MKFETGFVSICLALSLILAFSMGKVFSEPTEVMVNTTTYECDNSDIIQALEIQTGTINKFTYDWRSSCGDVYLEDTFNDPLFETLKYVANAQEYKLDEYDCTEKAELLTYLLEELGYKAKSQFVNVDCDHYW